MYKLTTRILLASALTALAAPALAADIAEPPPVVEAPPVYEAAAFGGWYIRGDVDYHWSDMDGADYIVYSVPNGATGTFDTTELDGAWSVGGGVGYQVTKWFRTDLTADYWAGADFNGSTFGVCDGVPCSSEDTSSYSAFVLMANAYVDLGTYAGFTPYVGAGIGGAKVSWDGLRNSIDGVVTEHPGTDEWRFAWSLMAGASYCLTSNLLIDAGYRYTNIQGGRMFEYGAVGADFGAGPGFDDGFNVHEVRGGLRYQFGGASNCVAPVVAYQPEPVPAVYK
jgi:opacity protein-like surface antigen